MRICSKQQAVLIVNGLFLVALDIYSSQPGPFFTRIDMMRVKALAPTLI